MNRGQAWLGLVAFVLIVAACGSPSGPQAQSSNRPTATPAGISGSALGVIVIEGTGTGPSTTYLVAIIGVDGKVRASVRASEPKALRGLPPFVSVAGSRVYYLDGDTKLMSLAPDGADVGVASMPGGPNDRVVVAVDPQTARIAFGVVHVGQNTCPTPQVNPCYPPLSTQVSVENADGSGVHRLPGQLLPIAWHAGQIVLGATAGYVQNRGEVNPYLAASLKLMDAGTGEVTDMSARCSSQGDSITGPLSMTGIVCEHFASVQSSSLTVLSWDGRETVLASGLQPNSLPAVLSPDGTTAAIAIGNNNNSVHDLALAHDGQLSSLHISAAPVGWFDSTHLLVNSAFMSASTQGFEILDTASGRVQPVDLAGNTGFVAPYGAYFAALPWE